MHYKGSMTIYLCLIMSILISVIGTGIRSAAVANARLQIASAADLGLYSMFGQYDKACLEQTNLLFIDGGYGEEHLQMNRIYQALEQDISYNFLAGQGTVMQKNMWNAAVKKGSITGYTLATDAGGNVFKGQVIDYMERTLGAQGVRLLINKLQNEDAIVEKQQDNNNQKNSSEAIAEYEQLNEDAGQKEENINSSEIAEGEYISEQSENTLAEPDFVNPIEIIKRMKELGILTLVLSNPEEVSKKTIDLSDCVSGRSLQRGMGVISYHPDVDSIKGNLLFQEYILQNCCSYTDTAEKKSIQYELEYILQGKSSDIENLNGVVTHLLLMREAANAAHLMTDPVKKAQLSAAALAISVAIAMPYAESAIEGILLLCWAFGESVLDIRELLAGGKIALVKDSSSWQLSVENLPHLAEGLDRFRKSSPKGLSYNDYLRILFTLKNGQDKLMRSMDVMELRVRQNAEKQNFRLDSCIAALEIQMEMSACNQTFLIQRNYGYDM